MREELYLGVEFGGTKLQLGLGFGDGRLLALERQSVDPSHGATGILAQVAEAVEPLTRRVGERPTSLKGAGVGFGGPVDAARGIVLKSHQVPGWDDFPLAEWMRQTLGIPHVALQNDADTAALAEACFGAGVGLSPVLYVTIGSGIGGGLVMDGRIYLGSGQGATEIGHLWVTDLNHPDHPPAVLEDVASGWAIARAARQFAEIKRDRGDTGWNVLMLAQNDPAAITTELVAQAARAGDATATRLIENAAQAVAGALAHTVTLLAPRRIILGGGVSLIDEPLWLEPIRRGLDAKVFPPLRGTFDVVAAALGEEVVVHGALALARGGVTDSH